MSNDKHKPDGTNNDFIHWFRQASPYIHKHRKKIIVVMLPGNFIQAPYLSNIVNDLAVLRSLGLKIVVVHGARQQIETALEHNSTFHMGSRVTAHEDMEQIINVVGSTRFQIEAAFTYGLPNSAMHGSRLRIRSGNFVNAKPRGVIDGIDFQYTGEVRSIDGEGVIKELASGNIAVISPLGYSYTGEVFNLSFADVAVHIASAIQADKLIAYNDDGRITDVRNTHYREMTLLQCKKFLVEKQNHSRSNSYFSLKACHEACDKGVSRAHIISAYEEGAILKELYTRDGSGTMIYRDSYETIRRANIEDVSGILNLISPLEESGVLVKRSRELLETEIHCFTVMEKDKLVIGCAALYAYTDKRYGELACVTIHDEYRGSNRAKKLLLHLERQAARLGINTLFVLTTQTAHWFVENGFVEGLVDDLPIEKQALYNFQRNSKVFTKRIVVNASTVDI